MRVFLIRHASTSIHATHLAGRQSGIQLSNRGLTEAAELSSRLRKTRFDAVYASPLERAMQTAAAIGNIVKPAPELIEMDFGFWTGRSFQDLNGDAHWHRFNTFRSITRAPNGETMAEAQLRAVNFLLKQEANVTFAAVTHADIIRAVLMFALGMPLDSVHRLVVDPASVSIVDFFPDAASVVAINNTA